MMEKGQLAEIDSVVHLVEIDAQEGYARGKSRGKVEHKGEILRHRHHNVQSSHFLLVLELFHCIKALRGDAADGSHNLSS